MSADRERPVAAALRDHGPLAPPSLRERVEAQIEQANERRGLQLPVMRVAVGGAVASLLVALALFLPAILGGDPTVVETHQLSSSGPTEPAPAPQAERPELLAADVDGVPFPDWQSEFGWRATGERSDELDGRGTRTVFYEHEGHTIAYTIVSGSALDPPADAERHELNGVELRSFNDDHGHDIVVFERGGHTCVLSGHVEHRSTLLELASWAGDGRVEF